MSRFGQFTRKLILYRNGDPSFKPVTFLYNNSRIRTYDKLLEELDDRVPPLRGGAVKHLYTEDGNYKVDNIGQLEGDRSDLVLVVAGPEAYRPVKGGYTSIGTKKPTPPKPDLLTPSRTQLPARPKEQSIRIRGDVTADTKKILLVRCGDATFGPRQFILRHRYIKSLDALLEDLSRIAPPTVYPPPSYRGDVTADTKKILLVRCGDATFGPRQFILRHRYIKSLDALLEDLSRIAPPSDGGSTRLFTIHGQEVASLEEIQNGMTYAVGGDFGFVEPRGGFPGHGVLKRGRSSESMLRSPAASPAASPRSSPRGSPRPWSERLYNRPDQIKPNSIFIFLFRNGDGLTAKRLTFNQFQLGRGWPWFLEQLAKVFAVYPKKLRAMDGREVNHVEQLMQKGAYVLVPLGEKFRDDCWYYLPDHAVDTSAEATGIFPHLLGGREQKETE